jgi:hypothetical protein
VLALTTTGALELTAYATLGLALVTGALAAATFWMVKLTRGALAQNQQEIALSRREVEEAHRPVVVPVADTRRMEPAGAGRPTGPAVPVVYEAGRLLVPVENVGSGPALRLEATVEQWLTEDGEPAALPPGTQKPAAAAGLGSGVLMPLEIGLERVTGLSGFWLSMIYSDVAGKRWVTSARFIPARGRYEDVTIESA